jgi:tetratricopeptide (TPR) repeat protein
VALSLNNIGVALRVLGKTEEGLAYYKQALEIRKALYGDKHPNVATGLNNIGATLLSWGQLQKALTACQQALKIYLNSTIPVIQVSKTFKNGLTPFKANCSNETLFKKNH